VATTRVRRASAAIDAGSWASPTTSPAHAELGAHRLEAAGVAPPTAHRSPGGAAAASEAATSRPVKPLAPQTIRSNSRAGMGRGYPPRPAAGAALAGAHPPAPWRRLGAVPPLLTLLVDVVLPVFAVVAVGGVVGRRFRLEVARSTEWPSTGRCPALVFRTLAGIEMAWQPVLHLVGAYLAFMLAMAAIAALAARRWPAPSRRALVGTSVFGNAANLNLPVALFAFGEAGLERALVLYVVTSLAMFSVGPALMGRAGGPRRGGAGRARLPGPVGLAGRARRQRAGSLLAVGALSGAVAQEVIVYSPFSDEFMQALARPFTEQTGIRVLNIVISTGESQSRLRAEAARPQADFWLSVRPAILQQAFDEGLIEAYARRGRHRAAGVPVREDTSPRSAPTRWCSSTTPRPWSAPVFPCRPATGTSSSTRPTAATSSCRTRRRPAPPTPRSPRSCSAPSRAAAPRRTAGTTSVAAQNVAQFTRSGRAPQTLVSQGEYPVGIGFYDAVWQLQQEGFPVEVVIPDPVFAEPYGGAVVAGAPNPENARAFFDYLVTPRRRTCWASSATTPSSPAPPCPRAASRCPPSR
jgi:iron(III) transport system substrate-binding protein